MLRQTLLLFILVIGLLFLSPLQATSEAPAGMDDKISCFTYHKFGEEEQYPSTSISTELFEEHLEYLEQNDYTVLTLGKALQRLHSENDLPERTAVLTIDDAYKSIKTKALPLLQEYGYKATIFASTNHVGGKNYLSWEDLQALQDQGFEIGNHSHSHAHFVNFDQDRRVDEFEQDLEKSQRLFQENLNKTVELYAYPFGEYCPGMQKILQKHGYKAAAAQRSGIIHKDSDQFALPRFPMNQSYGKMEKFTEKIGMYPLGVMDVDPKNPVLSDPKEPEFTLTVQNKLINTDGMQCFLNGKRNCKIETEAKNSTMFIRVRADKKMESRRSTFTITAPSREGQKWFWHTRVLITPEYGE
ncbi:MAG: polysaccharide deacetylase family protein [Thermodesulfobacteriota bacterium]